VIIAINGLRINAADAADGLNTALARYRVGEVVEVHAFRRDELLVVKAKLQADDVPTNQLKLEVNHQAALATARPTYKKAAKR